MRHDTDTLPEHDFTGFPGHGQDLSGAWSVSPDDRPPPRPSPGRASETSYGDQIRSKRRPHIRYTSPAEMWAWHWVRMRIVLSWALVLVAALVAVTAGVVIVSEFW